MRDSVPDPKLIVIAEKMAEASRPIIRKYFRTGAEHEKKADESPVTIADREVEKALRRILRDEFPTHGILGEEEGGENLGAEYVWVLDPIDGTKAFVIGQPTFGTLISLCRNGRPILGVIDQAITDERWVGASGYKTTLNGEEIQVRECSKLEDAVLESTSPHLFLGEERKAFDRLTQKVRWPLYGCDCYAYGLLAHGLVDLVVESSLHPYDYCAVVPIIEGAGGRITDWQGEPLGIQSGSRVVAAGDQRMLTATLDVLHERKRES